MTREFVRFSAWQRFQHITVMILFFLLCVTGLPQKYFDATWAAAVIGMMGGVDAARFLHRVCGVGFTGLLLLHVGDLVLRLARGTGSTAMVPQWKDVTDALTTLRYYVGLGRHQAQFDRFDYKQKFEYWGMMLGSFIVVATGLILLFPIPITSVLPGAVLPVAVVAHSSEGLLAFLTIITWHIFNAALAPEVFPLDTSMFTGRITEERMQHEHPLELQRLSAGEGTAPPAAGHGT